MDPDSIPWLDSMNSEGIIYLDNMDRHIFILSHDLKARARYALSRIISRPQSIGEQRFWEADPTPSSPTCWEARPRPISPKDWVADLAPDSPVRKQADPQAAQIPPPSTSPTSLLPPLRVNQQVLIMGRPLKFNTHTVFTVSDVYTRDLRTMQKSPWTPQTVYTLVELRLSCTSATKASDTDALVVPLSRVVPLPEFLSTPSHRYKVFSYVYVDNKGVRTENRVHGGKKLRRYVERFWGVWAEEGGKKGKVTNWSMPEENFGGCAKYGEVWVLLEWVDGAKGVVEKVKANDLETAEQADFDRDLDEFEAEKKLKKKKKKKKKKERGGGLKVGGNGQEAGGEEEDITDPAGLETEYDFRNVLEEFGLE